MDNTHTTSRQHTRIRGLIALTPPLACSVQGMHPSSSGGSTHQQWLGLVYGIGEEFVLVKPIEATMSTAKSQTSAFFPGGPTLVETQISDDGPWSLTITFDHTHVYQIQTQRDHAAHEDRLGQDPAPGHQHSLGLLADRILFKTQEIKETQKLGDLLTLVRKNQHISLCSSVDVEAKDRFTGFSEVILKPQALPELDWEELNTKTSFLGHHFSYPIMITGMTGGLERGATINRNLALAAQALGIPMGVGSQRVALDNPEHSAIFSVKKFAPHVFLIGNLGIAQIAHLSPQKALDLCLRAADMIDADALALHANVLQEAVQIEGDRNFRGVLQNIEFITARLGIPVILKEVGVGLDGATGLRLREIGVAALDVGGKGGTSWSYIEGLRTSEPLVRQVAEVYRDWGIPTAVALFELSRLFSVSPTPMPLIATGGMRDGLMIAKGVALGATLCGVGLPLLKAALKSTEDVIYTVDTLVHGLKTAMIATGSETLRDLKKPLRISRAFKDLVDLWGAGDEIPRIPKIHPHSEVIQ